MRFHPQNNWFHGCEFMRACTAVHLARGSLSFMTASAGPGFRAKYLQIYVDQRTGGFIFRDGDGKMLTHVEVYAMFPELEYTGTESVAEWYDPIAAQVAHSGQLPG